MLIDFIAISLPGNNYQYQDAYNVQQFLANLLFLNGTFPSRIPGIKLIPFGSARPLWTLAIEWWFYMLFGYCYFTIKENRSLNFKRICVLLFLLIMPSEYIISGRGGGLGFCFCLGIISYYVYDKIEDKIAVPLLCGLFITYVFVGIALRRAYCIWSFGTLCLIFCTCMKICSRKRENQRNKVLAFVSKSTFMLYLIHYSIIDLLCTTFLPIGKKECFIIGIIVSVAAAMIMYYMFGGKNILGKKWVRQI